MDFMLYTVHSQRQQLRNVTFSFCINAHFQTRNACFSDDLFQNKCIINKCNLQILDGRCQCLEIPATKSRLLLRVTFEYYNDAYIFLIGTYNDCLVKRVDLGGNIGATSSQKVKFKSIWIIIHYMFACRAPCDFINIWYYNIYCVLSVDVS